MERLSFAATSPRVESSGNGKPMIVGYACVFDVWTTRYEDSAYVYRVRILPGAFDACLGGKPEPDVRALFNHDPNYVLGRLSAGTLRLRADARGLVDEIDPPDTGTIRDLVLGPIGRGDVTGQSFSFNVRPQGERTAYTRDADNRVVEERELLALDLVDVGPVTFPQFPETDVAVFGARASEYFRKRAEAFRRLKLRGLGLRLQGLDFCGVKR